MSRFEPEMRRRPPREDPFAAGDWELCPWKPGQVIRVSPGQLSETVELLRRYRR